ncbi:hypothetical protein [Hymenobacter sp. BT491]|uniref:hypothetical protein n=1 Tax=Hymenobacter sp. BT491 TaxID=2766779 RepID=UPI001653565E|nr:hypothetical protein [Hymenobacter sp. BT491]MBC6988925.1 hypothetical protein [Hymenobacter sp. BT491]
MWRKVKSWLYNTFIGDPDRYIEPYFPFDDEEGEQMWRAAYEGRQDERKSEALAKEAKDLLRKPRK